MLREFLKRSDKEVKIYVIGDLILDGSKKVTVTRISPESPNCNVMLAEDDEIEYSPGGAGKVVSSLKEFKGLELFCFSDPEAKKYVSCTSIDIKNKIPRKIRYFDGCFQVGNRLDIEKKNYGLTDKEIRKYQQLLRDKIKEKPDIFIYSDYNKGIFSNTDFLQDLQAKHIIVDPKDHPVQKWKDKCTIFKPNFKESYELSGGIKDVKKRCLYFQKEIGCDNVLVTNEGNGFFLKEKDDFYEFSPKKKVTNPVCLSGAGDLFAKFVSLALAYDFSLKEAATIAFQVCSVYVTSREPLTKDCLLAIIENKNEGKCFGFSG